MNDRELYLVWHDQGWPGSWLAWFVNMHTNFPQFEGRYSYSTTHEYDDFGTQREYPLHFLNDGNPWHSAIATTTSETILTFDEHIHKWIDMQDYVNKQSTKIALRFHDNHQSLQAEELKLAEAIIDDHSFPQVKGNIGMVAGEASNKIYNRLLDLNINKDWRSAELDEIGISSVDNINIENGFPYLEKIAPTHIVDFGKFLNYDEEEYNKLVKFIEEKPLKNWKEHVKVITTIFDRY